MVETSSKLISRRGRLGVRAGGIFVWAELHAGQKHPLPDCDSFSGKPNPLLIFDLSALAAEVGMVIYMPSHIPNF